MGTHTQLKTERNPGLKSITFSAKLPSAKEVSVTGDFTEWSLEGVCLYPIGDGEWATTLELAPGEYEYRLLVDGEWHDHPGAARRVSNPFGGENCLLTVS